MPRITAADAIPYMVVAVIVVLIFLGMQSTVTDNTIPYVSFDGPVTMTKAQSIESIDRDIVTGGSFALGFGTVKGYQSYSYYVVDSRGGHRIHSIRADQCVLYEDEEIDPYIQVQYTSGSGKWVGDDPGSIGDDYIRSESRIVNGVVRYGVMERTGEIEIHVPNRTVKKTYSV